MAFEPSAEPKLADRLVKLHNQGLSCAHVTALGPFVLTLTVCYQTQLNGHLILTTRFVLKAKENFPPRN